MSKIVEAEYLAEEGVLKLARPLDGIADHERVRVVVERSSSPRFAHECDPRSRESHPWIGFTPCASTRIAFEAGITRSAGGCAQFIDGRSRPRRSMSP
jgi:predicted DNA-binding antitoxin AbrB/MazE fold protein